ncbi:DMT family transporter [Hoeflea sp.]|uniref:DMT family transporter n=1 Tax=Hoeflea sp. TaxID=1940281 RepID=UPI003A938201
MRALALMAGGMFMFAAADAQAKFLSQTLSSLQIVWSRQLGLFIGVIVLLFMHGLPVLHTAHPKLQILRGALAAGSATLFVMAVRYVPLADAVAVSFVAPFVVTVFGALLLHEHVGIRRWLAVAAGFIGMLIVIRPGLGVIHPAAFLVAIAASLFAFRQILSRHLAATDRTSTTGAYTAIVAIVVLTVPLPFVWQTPQTTIEIVVLVGLSVSAAFGEFLIIKSLEIGQAVVVAPVQYTMLLWGTVYGFLVFGQLPDEWTWVGALIIVTTGLYTLHRERLASRKAAKIRSAPPEAG